MKTNVKTILKSGALALALAVTAVPVAIAGGGHSHHSKPHWHHGYGWSHGYPHVQFYYQKPIHYGYVAWTPSWYAYCKNRYRSFNPATGYFRGYDGRLYFCK